VQRGVSKHRAHPSSRYHRAPYFIFTYSFFLSCSNAKIDASRRLEADTPPLAATTRLTLFLLHYFFCLVRKKKDASRRLEADSPPLAATARRKVAQVLAQLG
jgi:hypothetical protein